MNRRHRPRNPVRLTRLFQETLEPRHLLAVDVSTTSALAVETIVWQGQEADVREGYWNGRFEAATPYGSPALPASLLPLPTWTTTSLGEGYFSLFAPDADSQLVVDWAGQTPGVLAIEPDFVVIAPLGETTMALATDTEPESIPNDPDFPLQWAPPRIQATAAWSASIGAPSVIVAVLDSGIDLAHPDLEANVWTNPGDVPDNGVDDEFNGFVDDIWGWNFVDDNNDVQDRYGHGTHVAGIIGAVGNNGVGVAGLNWRVAIMPLKILGDNGLGTASMALAAMSYVTTMRRDFETNIVVSNNSWGAATGYSVVMRDAIAAMSDVGIGFIAAAGNSGSDNDVLARYPSSYDVPNVIAVTASTSVDELASFANYGAQSVDLAAPGSGIYSTLTNGSYGFLSGTSMAAPQVAGAFALLSAAKPGLTVAEAKAAILGSTDTVDALVGSTVTGGRLNISGAMKSLGLSPVPPPEPPPPPPPPVPAEQPFTDDFNQADAPTLSGYWTTRAGAVGIDNQEAVPRSSRVSIATLNGVNIADSVSQAFVNLRTGRTVGLVARYSGSGDRNMYYAGIVPAGTTYTGRIWRNLGGTWRVLSSGPVTAASGVLRFEVAGSSLTLLFNGTRITGAFDRTITRPGAVGIRLTGGGGSIDNYAQTTLTAPVPTTPVLPFTDGFNGGDSPFVPGSWTKRIGNLGIVNGVVVSRFNGVSIMALNGVTTRDSSSQAFVNVVNGKLVTLVARYTGAGDNRMYCAGLVRSGNGFLGRIWLHRAGRWRLLASGESPGGSGTLRFDVVGTALTLFLNDKRIAAASNRAITGPGALGMRFVGSSGVADNFQAAALVPPTPTAPVSPFSDDFIRADSPYLSSSWVQPFGNVVLQDDSVVSQIDGVSVATLYGVASVNSSTQAVVNINSGKMAGLVARYRGASDRRMYVAGLVRVGDAFYGRIWRNNGCRWSVLASARVEGGSGRIKFDRIGRSLSLSLNGDLIATARDATLRGSGAVGIRLVGENSRVSSFSYAEV
jgi:thermitase